jgi:hypothetical protein
VADELGVLFFQPQQLLKKLIIGRISNLRVIETIIAVIMVATL